MASKEDNVAVALSPAAKYQQLLLETGCGQPGPNEEKMLLVFKVLDQITPHLGVFVEVMKLCRDELFEAVYSDQYTGSDQDKKKKRYIQRLPFFTLVKRVYDERDEKNEKLNQQLDQVKEKLFNKQVQYEEACDHVEELEKDVATMKEVIEQLEKTLEARNEDYESLEQTLEEVRDTASKEQYQLECDIQELKEDLHEARTEAAYLLQFKNGYDELQQAFVEQPEYEGAGKRKITPPVATKRSHFISCIENANRLEEQLLTVQNATIEEFDTFLEKHKEEVSEQAEMAEDDHLTTTHTAAHSDMDIDATDHQLLLEQQRFEKSVEDINLELSLLRQQRTAFMEQLQQLEENKPVVKEKKPKRPKTQESSLSADLEEAAEEEEESSAADPFSLQESIFSRYASMLYASDNNAKTFHEFQDAEYCKSCGEKTAVCPHKILRQEHIFVLPPNATHIKLSRPKVRLNNKLINEALREAGKGSRAPITSSKSLRSRMSISVALSPLTPAATAAAAMTPASDASDALSGFGEGDLDAAHFIHSVDRLWEDYKKRTSLERMVPRPLSMRQILSLLNQYMARVLCNDHLDLHHQELPHFLFRVLSLMQQFGGHLAWQDFHAYGEKFMFLTFSDWVNNFLKDFLGAMFSRDISSNNPDMRDWLNSLYLIIMFSSQDSLYLFMSERYLKEDIMYFAMHDLISAIIKNAPTNKTIWLFAQCLIGNLDAAVFRYMLLIGDFINEVDWQDVEDFKAFAEVIYPFLNEDDLDGFQMNYTSFSENTISKTLVAEFIVYNIMKYREPRFIEYENKLLAVHAGEHTSMSEGEFVDATDEALGVVNDKLRRRLFHEALAYVRSKDNMQGGVPIARLAQITSYLSLLEVMQVIKGSVGQKVKEARQKLQEDTTTGKPAHMRISHHVPAQYELLTWSTAQALAQAIVKQKAAKQMLGKPAEA